MPVWDQERRLCNMDIRNIKEVAPDVADGQLEKLYDLQRELMKGYLKIEKDLPEWPIDVNSRKGQVVLKDMSARVIEEMGEGYESTGYALELLDKYGYNLDIIPMNDRQMLLNHLQNSNEEQADAIAFYIELMLYSNILPVDIYSYVERVIFADPEYNNIKAGLHWRQNLQGLMDIGLCILEDRFCGISRRAFHVLDESWFETHEDYEKVKGYTPGYNDLSWDFHDQEAKYCWEISYHLSVARNFLKNKPWKQTGEMTDEKAYQSEVVIGFIEYLGYLKFVGMDAQSAYVLRFKKHLVNVFRQTSNY